MSGQSHHRNSTSQGRDLSKSFPLNVKKANGPGRPAKDGERYPGGDLKSHDAGPTKEALAQKEAARVDPTQMGTPLDAAYVGGWLEFEEYRAARAYISLYRRTSPACGPRLAMFSLPEADPSLNELRGRKLTRAEIAQLWDEIVGEEAPETDEERERRHELIAAKWRSVNAAMTDRSRAEVFAVCVRESWPQWIVQRSAGERLRAKAVSENRALTDDELAYIAKKFASSWEGKRKLLVGGLRAVANVLRDAASPTVGLARPMSREPRPPAPPIGTRLIEATHYVDADGAPVLIVEKMGRRLCD